MKDKKIILGNNERIDELGIDNLKLIQNKKYFCFGTDSVLLANFVRSNSSNSTIIDFCSGSGIISIIVSKKKKCGKILAVELQKEMFDLLQRNIEYNNLQEKIIPFLSDIKNYEKIRKEILNISKNGTVDIIICNPPYKTVGTGIANEEDVKYIARHEITCTLEDVFICASNLLNTKGRLYLVHKPERLVDLIEIARRYRLEAKRIKFVQPNINSKPSIVLLEYVKDGKNEVIIEKPLIEYDKNGNYTKDFIEIYN